MIGKELANIATRQLANNSLIEKTIGKQTTNRTIELKQLTNNSKQRNNITQQATQTTYVLTQTTHILAQYITKTLSQTTQLYNNRTQTIVKQLKQ